MKKNLLLVVFAFFALGASAQDYKPFQLYLGLGYAMPLDGGGGVLFDIEPAYRLSDAFAIGLRLESAAMAKVVGTTETSISGVGSISANAKYYLGSSNFRPYIGAGVGYFSIGSVSASSGGGSVDLGGVIGFYPRVGFDAGHFNMNLDLNIIGKSSISESFGDIDPVKNSYIGIRIGAFIFGGKN